MDRVKTGKNTMNMAGWIEKWAMIHPDKVAIIAENIPYTYKDLNCRINRLSNLLLDKGLQKGDRVGVLIHNSLSFVEAVFALSRLGCICVPLNWRLAQPELAFILKDSTSSMLIFEEEFTDVVNGIRGEIDVHTYISCAPGQDKPVAYAPSWAIEYESSIMLYNETSVEIPWTLDDEDPHILMYTSGTTGIPKGAILSHRKTFFNVLNAEIYFDLSTHDIAIIARPLFHSGGLIVELAPLLYKGGTCIVKRRFRPQEILKTIEKYKVTILELPATVYYFILTECEIEKYNLTSLKCCFTGGERVPVNLLQAFAEKGITISQIYGLTEASTLFWLPYAQARAKMGSVGKPVFHSEVAIVDTHGKPVGAGEIGEIIVRGPVVMSGYWNRKDLTKEVIKHGWLHTGDLARMDEEGFVYIVDRKKDMFISGGENVYPAEIEKILFTHPKVLDCGVVGVPDEKWGEVGKAFIVPQDMNDISREEMYAFLKDKVAKYKIPKYIEFVERLPKTASGKIKKHLLKKM